MLDVIASFHAAPGNDADDGCGMREEELVQLILQHIPSFVLTTAKGYDWGLGPFNEEAAKAREEELESLAATYGDELNVVSEAEWVISVSADAALRVHLTPEYPASQPPYPIVEGAEGV